MAEFDKKAYDQEYSRANIITKRVPFNRGQEDDMRLLAFAESRPGSFSSYIKRLIAQDLVKSEGYDAAP